MKFKGIALTAALSLIATTGVLAGTVPASAYSSSVALTIADSKCSDKLTWKGAFKKASGSQGNWPGVKPQQKTGTVKFCTTKLKVTNSEKKDYFVIDLKSTWKTTKTTLWSGADPWTASASSDTASVGSEFAATETFKKSLTKVGDVSVGVSVGFLSFSAGNSIDRLTEVKQTSEHSKGAAWKGADVDDVNVTELVFAQAVKKKQNPTYTVKYTYPHHTYTWRKQKTTVRNVTYDAQVPVLSGGKTKTITHKLK